MIPAAIDWGVFSGIKLFLSILIATKLQTFVNSELIFNLLQYLSIKDIGFVLQNEVFTLLSNWDS